MNETEVTESIGTESADDSNINDSAGDGENNPSGTQNEADEVHKVGVSTYTVEQISRVVMAALLVLTGKLFPESYTEKDEDGKDKVITPPAADLTELEFYREYAQVIESLVYHRLSNLYTPLTTISETELLILKTIPENVISPHLYNTVLRLVVTTTAALLVNAPAPSTP